jgi:TPR repeat protein
MVDRAIKTLLVPLAAAFIIGCWHAEEDELEDLIGGRDEIRFVGAVDNFRCDDPAYANVKKLQTYTFMFADGTSLAYCRPDGADAFAADGPCPDFRCEGPSQYRDLVVGVRRGDDLREATAMYEKAKKAGNMTDAWSAILMAQDSAPRQADEMWNDFWHSQVVHRFEHRPHRALEALQASAARGLPSAMERLGAVYAKGEFGAAVNPRLSNEWKSKAAAARAAHGARP